MWATFPPVYSAFLSLKVNIQATGELSDERAYFTIWEQIHPMMFVPGPSTQLGPPEGQILVDYAVGREKQ